MTSSISTLVDLRNTKWIIIIITTTTTTTTTTTHKGGIVEPHNFEGW